MVLLLKLIKMFNLLHPSVLQLSTQLFSLFGLSKKAESQKLSGHDPFFTRSDKKFKNAKQNVVDNQTPNIKDCQGLIQYTHYIDILSQYGQKQASESEKVQYSFFKSC